MKRLCISLTKDLKIESVKIAELESALTGRRYSMLTKRMRMDCSLLRMLQLLPQASFEILQQRITDYNNKVQSEFFDREGQALGVSCMSFYVVLL